MKIGILGAGNVGGALGTTWARAGHDLFYGLRDASSKDTQVLLQQCGTRAAAGTPQQAAVFADAVVIALPWAAAYEALPSLNLAGKIVIDCSNPPAALPNGAHSGAEALAALAPQARFTKAFNITGSANMQNPAYPDGPLAMFFCGDDAEAKRATEALIKATGFQAFDLGPLSNARLMEDHARLWIWLAYKGGLGRDFGFRIAKR